MNFSFLRKNRNQINLQYFKNYSLIIFSILFIIISLIYHFDDILFLRPQSFHQWRQCDCLSLALNYYEHDISFFSPQIQFLGNDGTGKTASDFPLIYYGVAQLWKVFGYHEFIYRLLVISISFLGLLALMKTLEDLLKDSFIAIFVSLLMYTSTIFVFYTNNFLTNVPALSIALIALYFFYRFYKTQKNRYLNISMLVYLIGGLLKITALTSYTAILALFVLEILGFVRLKNNEKLFNKPFFQIIPFVLVAIVVFSWYHYAFLYTKTYNSGVFLIGILPIWELTNEKILEIFDHARILWFDSYHSEHMQFLSVLFLAIIFIFFKKQNKFLLLFTSFLLIGFLLYILLWYSVFGNHDYYMVNQLIFMISILTTFFYFIRKSYHKLFTNIWFRLVLIALLIHNINLCADNINFRYTNWPNEGHQKETYALETITPYLDSIGIGPDKKVLFMYDPSFNISLYLMNRRGYTAHKDSDQDRVLGQMQKVDYFLLNDSSLLDKDYIRDAIKEKVGSYQNIQIFSVK